MDVVVIVVITGVVGIVLYYGWLRLMASYIRLWHPLVGGFLHIRLEGPLRLIPRLLIRAREGSLVVCFIRDLQLGWLFVIQQGGFVLLLLRLGH